MESALTELRWSTFERGYGERRSDPRGPVPGRGRARGKEFGRRGGRLPFGRRQAGVKPVRRCYWRSATCSPRPLPDDYRNLCLCFTLSDAEGAALDFALPEMVQPTFYTMLLNDAIELGIMSGPMAVDLKLTLEGLRWASFESWLSRNNHDLMEGCSNEAAELGLSSKAPMDRMMLDLGELKWDIVEDIDERLRDAHVPRLIEILANPQPPVRPEETSRLRGTPPISSDDDTLSWSSCEYSSTPSILSMEEEAQRMAKTKSTSRMRSPNELLAEGTLEGNPCSAPSSSRPVAEVMGRRRVRPQKGRQQVLRPAKGLPLRGGFVLKKRGRAQVEPIPEIVANGPDFPGAPPARTRRMVRAVISPIRRSFPR
ncbi:hypothetical protein Cgig2_028739 [Carnegiea gigantea]|uniref:Uncharacterized protein n=1 Tax=Carnegiea gigantea TaxID=171969 RepID=A0A9Q1GRK6_9CARY|nr:hypothetical protein Cgig2_028739 [Carnegiea gigantea]